MTIATAGQPVFDRTGELVLSAWSTVSPFGLGRDAFRDGVLAGSDGIGPLDQDTFPGRYERAGLVPGFTAAGQLGRKGTRSMDRLTALAIKTVGLLVEDCGPELTASPERVGLVLGTGSGSVQSIMEFSNDSLSGERPYHVDPARFPNTVMNKAAAASAIWHCVRGPNTTITGDSLTGLLALSYAVRLYRGGHCDRVLLGAVEEYSVLRAWLEWHAHAPEVLGEGGAMFVLENRDDAVHSGRLPLATVVATRFGAFDSPAGQQDALRACVLGALHQIGARTSDVRAVAPLGAEAEEDVVRDALVDADPLWIRCRPLLGDTSAASTGFQLAAVLSLATSGSLRSDDLALVTAIDRAGTVGCALLRIC